MSMAHFPYYRTSYGGAPLILDQLNYYQQSEPYINTNLKGYFYPPRNQNEREINGIDYYGRTNIYGIENDNLNTKYENEYLRQTDDYYYQQPQYFYRESHLPVSAPSLQSSLPPLPLSQAPVFQYYNSPGLWESKVYQYQNINPPRHYILNQENYKNLINFPDTSYEKTHDKSSTHHDCTLDKTKIQDDDTFETKTSTTTTTTTASSSSSSITTIKPDDIEMPSEKIEEIVTEVIKIDDDDDNSSEQTTEQQISTETIPITEQTKEYQQESSHE